MNFKQEISCTFANILNESLEKARYIYFQILYRPANRYVFHSAICAFNAIPMEIH